MATALSHHRHTSYSKKQLQGHARPSRPAPLTKRAVSHGTHKSGNKTAQRKEEEEEDPMATSFLQFCATCDKQIIVPNNSVLYCSESCRKKDNNKPLSCTPYTCDQSPPLTPFANFTFDDLPVRDIVPQRSPTAISNNRLSYSETDDDDDDDDNNGYSEDKKRSRHATEAARYLGQFQSPAALAKTSTRPSRPRFNRSSTSMANVSMAPSLSHTPTSSTSMSLPYTPASTRPLPPRTNPHSSSYGARSIDLVTPYTTMPTTAPSSFSHYSSLKTSSAAGTSVGVAEGEMSYEKSSIPSVSPSRGRLKQLFRFDEMQAAPTESEMGRPPYP